MVTEIIIVTLLIFSAIMHGITGIGFPLMSTMLVSFILPLPTAIAVVVLPNIILNLIILAPKKDCPQEHRLSPILKKYWPLVVSTILGSIVGVVLLRNLTSGWLNLMLTTAILFYIIQSLRKKPTTQKIEITDYNNFKMVAFGILAGVVGGATNAMSSILMLYLLAVSDNKNEIVKISNFCFLLSKVVQIILLKDQLLALDTKMLWLIPAITVLSIIMVIVGIKIRDRIPVEQFKKIILIMLLFFCLKTGYNAFVALI